MSWPKRIYLGFLVFLAIVGLAFVLPQVAARGEFGHAAGATAAITFLLTILVALAVAVGLLIATVLHLSALPTGAKIAGFLPLPLLLLLAGVLAMILIAKHREAQQASPTPPPRAVTAP